MKRFIYLITIFSFLTSNSIQAEEFNPKLCVNKYYKVVQSLSIGASAGIGTGLALTIGGIFFPPVAFAGLGIMGASVLMWPIRDSFDRSSNVLQSALKGDSGNYVSSGIKKVHKRRDRNNKSMLLSAQKRLFTQKSMKKWCTHPLYDYLTLKRKVRSGSIYGK